MEVAHLGRSLGIEDRKVVRKAEEFSRLCSVKRPMGLGTVSSDKEGKRMCFSVIVQADICKAAACLELACSELGAEFNRDRAVLLSGSSDKIFQIAISSIRASLGLK